jgi:hypothetical protein
MNGHCGSTVIKGQVTFEFVGRWLSAERPGLGVTTSADFAYRGNTPLQQRCNSTNIVRYSRGFGLQYGTVLHSISLVSPRSAHMLNAAPGEDALSGWQVPLPLSCSHRRFYAECCQSAARVPKRSNKVCARRPAPVRFLKKIRVRRAGCDIPVHASA